MIALSPSPGSGSGSQRRRSARQPRCTHLVVPAQRHGAISGSAIVRQVARWAAGELERDACLEAVRGLVGELKGATRG